MNDQTPDGSGQFAALQDVFDEAVGLFHLLRSVAEQLHGQGEMTAGRRGILRGLDRLGPQTVPQMARARPVSRQHIQAEVNHLEANGLVALIDNIAHKRSRLVRLTPKGKALLEAMNRREEEFFAASGLALPEDTLRTTAEVLHALRDELLQAQVRLRRAREQDTHTQAESSAEDKQL